MPFIVAILISHLIRVGARSPRCATLGVVGGFGHSVFSGITLVQLSMASDEQNRAAYVSVLEAVESWPAVTFMAMGLIGTVLDSSY